MKTFITLIFVIACVLVQSFFYFSRFAAYPIFDESVEAVVPRNLRTTEQAGDLESLSFNLEGLNRLKASGSGQFSERTFIEMVRWLSADLSCLIVLDLRQESHGLVNGIPISWTDGIHNYANINKTKKEIEIDEKQRLRLAAQAGRLIVDPVEEQIKLTIDHVKTEREFIEDLGGNYVRLPVTDHNRPSDEIIDQFIEIVKGLSDNHRIHFHCRAGKGRTTTFLTLLDIMKNSQNVSLDDILVRQQLIGGTDLTNADKRHEERNRAAKKRFEFIKHFYAYCRDIPDFHLSWSEWNQQQMTIAITSR